jgi:hypothetical protein
VTNNDGFYSALKGDRGLVFVNGIELDGVEWVNVKQGIARYAPRPARTMKGKRNDEIYTRIVRGSMRFEATNHDL